MASSQPPRAWTAEDEAFLREHYPKRGARYCATKLQRTRAAILARARVLGLAVESGPGVPVEISQAVDAAIRAAYRHPIRDGARARLPEQLGLSAAWISARALKIGARKPEAVRHPWTRKELDILAAHAAASAVTVRAALKEAGFRRSVYAVEYARTRFKAQPDEARLHTIPEAVDLLGVSKTSLHKWIKQGMLRLTAGGCGDGVGRMVVSDDDLVRFFIEHPHAIDLAKIQLAGSSAWFIDLLARKGTVATLTQAESQAERIIALVTARPELLNDRRQVALLLEIPFESCTVTISQAIKAGRIKPARAVA